MKLLVDIGNSRIKWAFWDGERMSPLSAVSHREANFDRLLHYIWRDLPRPTQVLVSNVAGEEVESALHTWTATTWHIVPTFIETSALAFGVKNGYEQFDKFGVDRWLALIAVYQEYGKEHPVIVIDSGTCMTVDVLDADGNHLGGLMTPGIHSSRRALTSYTAMPDIHVQSSAEEHDRLLAINTHEGIMGGTLFSCVAYLDRLIDEITLEMGPEVKAVITGGESVQLAKLVKHPLQVKENLVIEGLSYFAKQSEHQINKLNDSFVGDGYPFEVVSNPESMAN